MPQGAGVALENQTVTTYEHALAAALEWEVQGAPPPGVVADMKAWTASGHRALFVSVEGLRRRWEAVVDPVTRLLKLMPKAHFRVSQIR